MVSPLRKFKQIAAQTAHHQDLNMGEFIRSGLKDFLIDEVWEEDPTEVVAARAIASLCMENGAFNGFVVGLKAAIQFLDETFLGPKTTKERRSAHEELRQVLGGGGEEEEILEWINKHYVVTEG